MGGKGARARGRRCPEGISSVGCEVLMISKHSGESPALTSQESRTLGARQTHAPSGSRRGQRVGRWRSGRRGRPVQE